MSDSVVNADVEDVLSSVKRLVDEDGRDESEFIFVPAALTRKPGRLVLTDALRVSDEPPARHKTAPLKLTAQDSASQPTATTAANTPDGPMRLQPCDIVESGQTNAPNATLAGSQAVQTKSADADSTTSKSDLAVSLSAKIEALEAAIARTEDQWEPDGQTNDAYSGTKTRAVDWPVDDRPENIEGDDLDGTDQKVTFQRTSTPDDATGMDKRPSAIDLDDDALRELVRQIVREELQGALGERITKNLRKLVRREINRAIASHDLE